jgi:hypothetical protein
LLTAQKAITTQRTWGTKYVGSAISRLVQEIVNQTRILKMGGMLVVTVKLAEKKLAS